MKVFVFGGTGFIGSRVVKRLVKNGHDVSSLARSQEKAMFLKQLGASSKIGDLNRKETIRDAIEGSEVIVNLSNPSFLGRIGERKLRTLSQQNFNLIRNLLDAVAEVGNIPIILTEGTLAYGDSGSNWMNETSPYDLKGYARIGTLSVPYVQRVAKEKSLSIIKLLPGGVYGAGSWFKESVYALMKKGWFRTFGDGRNILSYVHVDDVAEAYRLAVEKLPIGESLAIVDDEPCKTVDFANCVAKQMGKPLIKSLPKWFANIIAGSVVVESLTINCKVRNAKAKKELGWKLRYPTYREGIPATLEEIEKSQ